MKKLFALALVVLGLAACQTDPSDLDVNFDGTTTVCLTLPEDAITRAGGSDSAATGLTNTSGEIVRFIMEIYDENGVKSAQRYVDYAEEGTLSVTFPVQLVPGRDYTFVAWADMVDAEADVDKYYNTADLKNITLNSEWNAMEETRDAFTDNCFIDDYSGASTIELNLKRPFAKVRVVATDLPQVKNLHLEPTTATVTYTKPIPVSYNAFEQKVGATTESKVHTKFDLVGANGEKLYGDNSDTQMVLYADYIFANNEQDAVSFTIETFDQNDLLIKETTFNTDIAVKRNMLTTIKGDIMTTSKNITVEIENAGEFGSTHDISAISSAAALLKAIKNGGNIMLTQDITITAADLLSAGILSTRSSAIEAILNLNGYDITFEDNVAVTIPENTTLTIQDNSESGEGSIVVENTTTTDGIDGGFVNEGTIVIEGGNLDEGTINNTTGEVTITNGNVDSNVVTGNTDDVTNYAAELLAAIAEGGEYTLGADVTIANNNANNSIGYQLPADKTLVLDLNGHTISTYSTDITSSIGAFVDVRGTLTVKNGTITTMQKNDYDWNKGAEIFYVGFGGTLNVENATLENLGGSDMAYCIDLVNADKGITVNVNNSTLKSTYIPFRIFNNGGGMNNVNIQNSTLEGTSRALWVHIYSDKDNGGKGVKDATLNLNFFGNGNTFIASNPNRIIEFGYDNVLNYDANGNLVIYNLYRLQSLATYVNGGKTFAGKTIYLAEDIDLNGENWAPIGTSENPFCGTLDGNGKTIKNLNIVEEEAKEGKAYIGLFGYAKDATIKNVTFENVNINIPCLDIDHSQGHIGAVAGSLEGTSTIENVTVKGDIKVYATQSANGASRVAVVAGGNSYGNVTMKNVHVIANEGSYLIANNNAGALAGQLQGKSVFENCSSNIDVTVNKFFAGGIIGLAAGDQLFENCHTTGDIAVVAGRSGKAHDHYRVGGIAGGWADGAKNVCTLTNCSYTGKLTGINSDGSVADKFDYLGYVGRGYTLNGCEGSTVVIDGISYVQKYNTAAEAGVYDIIDSEGYKLVNVSSEEELIAALTALGEKDRIILANDITVVNKWDSRYTGAKTTKPIFIDGNSKTLKFVCEVSDGGNHHAAFRFENEAIVKNLTIDMSEATGSGERSRAISSKEGKLTVDNCVFIGNANLTNTRGIIFGEGVSAAESNMIVSITNSTFTNWRRGVTDNENAKDAKDVTISNNTFNNAHAYISAHDSVVFNGNTMNNSAANIRTYTKAADAKVVATDNTLDANLADYNVIRDFVAENVECQDGFTVL